MTSGLRSDGVAVTPLIHINIGMFDFFSYAEFREALNSRPWALLPLYITASFQHYSIRIQMQAFLCMLLHISGAGTTTSPGSSAYTILLYLTREFGGSPSLRIASPSGLPLSLAPLSALPLTTPPLGGGLYRRHASHHPNQTCLIVFSL